MAIVILSLGTNIGNRQANLANALIEIEKKIGKIKFLSSIYETDAWGFESDSFLNQVVQVKTSFDPQTLINGCLGIEKELGRVRIEGSGYSSRIIDLDILFYDDLILQEEKLVIPHPYIQERRFILVPLNEIIPNYIHPVLHKKISQLLADCYDDGMVKPLAMK